MSDDTKIFLPESEMPQAWYNIQADLPSPLKPPLHPATNEPLGPEDLAPLFPMELIKQEMSTERWVDIPDDVLRVLKLWRPSPLHRAHNLEEYLGTPARIYWKNESVSPAGSHKPNTAVAQAYYNKAEGVTHLTTETGAGQWGCALAMSCAMMDMKCRVYQVRASYDAKPYRRLMMEVWGAECFPSPSPNTEAGRAVLAKDPDTSGSLGMAISDAVEDAVKDEHTKYALGSVLNHVLMHQTITGLEIRKQLAMVDETPDIIVGCVGGGSNFGGFAFPFVKDKLDGKDIRFVACEPTACPTLTRAPYRYDFGDTAQMTPLLKMYTLGHDFVPPAIHAGGLRYHGMSPLVSLLTSQNIIEPFAFQQSEVFKSAVLWAQCEGHLPAPETAHAIAGAIREALHCKETGEEKVIVIGYSGHGHFDLTSYEAYLNDEMTDYFLSDAELDEFTACLPEIPEA